MNKLLPKVILIVAGVFAALLVTEIFIALTLKYPDLPFLSKKYISELWSIYFYNTRKIIQFERGYIQHDPENIYVLRPGKFKFTNSEFSNEYRVNHLGLRDDERSLDSPDVVVLGDSIAMGWGVEQDEAFPQLIEKRTGLKVLNAAIASYGTVRECFLLDRIDTSKMKYLIVQYSGNDFEENELFFKGNGSLIIISSTNYDDACERYAKSRVYYPFKYVWHMIGEKVKRGTLWKTDVKAVTSSDGIQADESKDESYSNEAYYLLYALNKAQTKWLADVNVILLFTNSDPGLIRQLALATKGENRSVINCKRLSLVDAANSLSSADTKYILDDHPNRRGHELMADLVLQTMGY